MCIIRRLLNQDRINGHSYLLWISRQCAELPNAIFDADQTAEKTFRAMKGRFLFLKNRSKLPNLSVGAGPLSAPCPPTGSSSEFQTIEQFGLPLCGFLLFWEIGHRTYGFIHGAVWAY
jgi:hypothetical protein